MEQRIKLNISICRACDCTATSDLLVSQPLVPAQAGKVIVSLASHWPGISTYEFTALEREMSTLPMFQWSTITLSLPLNNVAVCVFVVNSCCCVKILTIYAEQHARCKKISADLSWSLTRDESLKPFANGLVSIFSFVIWSINELILYLKITVTNFNLLFTHLDVRKSSIFRYQ